MSERLADTTGARTGDAGTLPKSELQSFSAYLAAPLWALQGLIWVAAPKVQAQAEPFHITNVLLFELFWMSIAGAVAFSAASARQILTTMAAPTSRLNRWARILANLALGLATAATVSIVFAPLPAVQGIALAVMTNLLNAALVLLAGSLTLAAILSRRVDHGSLWVKALPTCLAALTTAMVGAIIASSTHSMVGLYFAVAVAILSGFAWLAWGRVSATAGRQQGRRD